MLAFWELFISLLVYHLLSAQILQLISLVVFCFPACQYDICLMLFFKLLFISLLVYHLFSAKMLQLISIFLLSDLTFFLMLDACFLRTVHFSACLSPLVSSQSARILQMMKDLGPKCTVLSDIKLHSTIRSIRLKSVLHVDVKGGHD